VKGKRRVEHSHCDPRRTLIHWEKYAGNPLLPTVDNKSSGIVVPDGDKFRLYTMHPGGIPSCITTLISLSSPSPLSWGEGVGG